MSRTAWQVYGQKIEVLEQLIQTIQVRMPGRCSRSLSLSLSLSLCVCVCVCVQLDVYMHIYTLAGENNTGRVWTDRQTDRFSLSLSVTRVPKHTDTHTGPAGPSRKKRGICGVQTARHASRRAGGNDCRCCGRARGSAEGEGGEHRVVFAGVWATVSLPAAVDLSG